MACAGSKIDYNKDYNLDYNDAMWCEGVRKNKV